MPYRNLILWYGGKFRALNEILPLVNNTKHKIFVEVFGGGGSIILNKNPSELDIYNDIHEGLISFFRVLRDRESMEKFKKLILLTPWSRTEWKTFRTKWRKEKNIIKKAFMFYYTTNLTFQGQIDVGNGGFRFCKTNRSHIKSYFKKMNYLFYFHKKILQLQIESLDWKRLIKTYDSEDTLFYLDPPYIHSTRKLPNAYNHEFTNANHREMLLYLVKKVKGKILLSGYNNIMYNKILVDKYGWGKKEFKAYIAINYKSEIDIKKAKEKRKRTEVLWISPNCNINIKRKSINELLKKES
ncbi:MAG: DNA adenine methylase [Candidatus Thorarchaeota archaeon]